jgi:hypothetical protein
MIKCAACRRIERRWRPTRAPVGGYTAGQSWATFSALTCIPCPAGSPKSEKLTRYAHSGVVVGTLTS